MSLVQAYAWLGAAQAGGLIGRPLWGWVAGRLGRIQPLPMVLGLVAGPWVFSALGAASSLGTAYRLWSAVALVGCVALWQVRDRTTGR